MSREPLQSAPDTEATASAQAGRGTEPQHPTTIADVGASAGNHALARLLTGPGGGVGLPAAVRTEAETRFGTSFEDVRVHTGDEAEQAAQALSARAFTVGANVYFGRGQYAPDTGSGREVLAHELTHVVQNRVGVASSGGGLEVSDPASESEREAEQAARAYIGGRLVEVPGADNAVVQRLPDEPTTTPVPGQTGNSLVRHLSGTTFTDDAGAVRAQLEDYVVKHGIESLARFESGYELHAADGGAPAGGWPGGLPGPTPAGGDPEYLNRVVTTVRTEIEKLRADAAAFMGVFQSRAIGILIRLLADSERRINEQFTLFGIKPNATTAFGFTLWTSYTGANNDQATLLAADVAALKAKLPAARAAKAEFETVTESSMKGSTDPAAVEPARMKWMVAQQAYDIVRNQVETAHPVLQAYNLDAHRMETPLTLDGLVSDGARARVLGDELTTEIRNIDKVRAAIADNPEYVWRLQPVIGSTRQLSDIQANPRLPDPSLQATVVTDKAASVDAAQELVNIGTAIATIGLGLIAAAATGGLAVAPATAVATTATAGVLNVALAYNAYQEYQFDSAAAGTDYERARLLSHDVPELFWLALQIVSMTVTGIGGAKTASRLFRRVVKLREEAFIAKEAREAVQARAIAADGESHKNALENILAELEATGNEVQPPAGRRLRAEVERDAHSARMRRNSVTDPDAEPDTIRNPVPDEAIQGKGVSRSEAVGQYFMEIQANPDREYGIIQHLVTKEFRVLTGSVEGVGIPQELGTGWQFVRHYHPNLEKDPLTGKLRPIPRDSKQGTFGARIPSVGDDTVPGDLAASKGASTDRAKFLAREADPGEVAVTKLASMERGQVPISETLDWFEPSTNRMRTSRFGYNPMSPTPFWMELPDKSGTIIKREFRTFDQARRWVRNQNLLAALPTGVNLGPAEK